jgi:uncharacterized protein HemY
MSNKQMTAVEEAIHLIKQDYEANGRLRLAFVLQTLNNAKQKERKQILKAYLQQSPIEDQVLTAVGKAEQYFIQSYGGQDK